MKIIEKIAVRREDNWNYAPATIAFLGDSVTQGCFEVYRKNEDHIETVFDQENGYHHHLARMLATLYPNVPINIINAGVSGGSAPHGLERLERDVLSHKPDLTVVCFALNDCGGGPEKLDTYLQALEETFTRLRESGSEIIFMTPNMMCTYVCYGITDEYILGAAQRCSKIQNEGGLDLYINSAKELCAKMGITVCDCYAKWQNMYRNGVDVTQLLANQINHPTREMNRLFAVSLLETMMG